MLRALFSMMSLRDWGLFTLLLAVMLAVGLARAEDGIPDNCENPAGAYYRQELFPRYEAQNRRLVLVNWTTGADEIVLATDLNDTQILGWSVDCHYLAGAVLAPGEDDTTVMDTVVWDVIANQRIGSVPDARDHPHQITWGPDEFLVVETRSGAVLWNVPANTQTIITTSWDPYTTRNFSRLRWDKTNHQLIVNFAVGGRAVYDLYTGQEIPLALNVTDSVPGDAETTVVIGGKAYECYGNWYVPDVHLNYSALNKTIFLELTDKYHPFEVIAVLEGDVDTPMFRSRGWSSSCRYVAASVGRPGTNSSDTIVWDVVENRRVGMFEDAQQITHPIYWAEFDDALVIETRDGAYLWHLPTDTRTLISDQTRTALADFSGIANFEDIEWNADAHQVLIMPLGTEEWIAFDVRTGQSVTPILPVEQPSRSSWEPLNADEQTLVAPTPMDGVSGRGRGGTGYNYRTKISVCGDFVLRHDVDASLTSVVNHQTGDVLSTLAGGDIGWVFSPDCRFVYGDEPFLKINNLPYDAHPLDDTYDDARSETLILWDAETGQRVMEMPNPYQEGGYWGISWSPGNDRALIQTTEGKFIWHIATGQTVLLTYADSAYGHGIGLDDYWDYSRGQILVSGRDAVYAFDMQTGAERYRFTTSPGDNYSCGSYWGMCDFSFSEDGQILFVGGFGSVGVWNLDTLEHAQVWVNWDTDYLDDRIALSPDGRYLVITRNMLRVWDLHNLPEDFRDRDPTYNYSGPFARVRSVRFVDNVTIETTSSEGVQRWNVETGELLSTEQ